MVRKTKIQSQREKEQAFNCCALMFIVTTSGQDNNIFYEFMQSVGVGVGTGGIATFPPIRRFQRPSKDLKKNHILSRNVDSHVVFPKICITRVILERWDALGKQKIHKYHHHDHVMKGEAEQKKKKGLMAIPGFCHFFLKHL